MSVKKHELHEERLSGLLAKYKKPEDLIGENGLLKQLIKLLVERVLHAELTGHLDYDRYESVAMMNRRDWIQLSAAAAAFGLPSFAHAQSAALKPSVVLNLAAIADPKRVKAVISEAPTPVGIGYPWSIQIPTLIVFGNEDDLGAPIGQRRWMISSPCRFASVFQEAPKGTTEECSVENPSGRMLTTLEWVKRVRKEGASSIDIEYFDGVAHGAFLGELRKETFSQYSARGGLLSNNSTIDFGWSQGATEEGKKKVFSRMVDFLHTH